MLLYPDGEFGVSYIQMSPLTREYGPDGMPMVRNSSLLLSNFQTLRDSISHANLAQYFDCRAGRGDAILLVQEWYPKSLADSLGDYAGNDAAVTNVAMSLFSALNYLHARDITHGTLCAEDILVRESGEIKLFNYGLDYMTVGGRLVSFPLATPRYLAPEVILNIHDVRDPASGTKSDVWSAAVVLVELWQGSLAWRDASASGDYAQLFARILTALRLHNESFYDVFKPVVPNESLLEKVFSGAFVVRYSDRITSADACELLIVDTSSHVKSHHLNPFTPTRKNFINTSANCPERIPSTLEEHLRLRPAAEVYHLLSLVSPALDTFLYRAGVLNPTPPVLSAPPLYDNSGQLLGALSETSTRSASAVPLPLEPLLERISGFPVRDFYLYLDDDTDNHTVTSGDHIPHSDSVELADELTGQPLAVLEHDASYQLRRCILFRRLLLSYPRHNDRLKREAARDIPPFYRGLVWAALLDVGGPIYEEYDRLDKVTPHASHHQIDLDLPRCHQYLPLFTTPTTYKKFHRLLSAFVQRYTDLVYWQGQDSMVTPFIYLNYSDESLAFACMCRFVDRYLLNWYLKDSTTIDEYLPVFYRLLQFHDAELTNHLTENEFNPGQPGLKWFMTQFVHVFPIDKILHLWDAILLHGESFPILVGVSIILLLRDTLMLCNDEKQQLLLGELPDLPVEPIASRAKLLHATTPTSLFRRKTSSLCDAQVAAANIASNPLDVSPPNVTELLQNVVALLAPRQLVEWLELREPPAYLLLDCRSSERHDRATLAGAVHCATPAIALREVVARRDAFAQAPVIVVCAQTTADANPFSTQLVEGGCDRVCQLQGGFSALRSVNGLLIIP